jgi:hypothetical protein
MNVETGVKAGNFFQDLSTATSNLSQKTSQFVAKANQEADNFTANLTYTAGSFLNCLSNSLSPRQ